MALSICHSSLKGFTGNVSEALILVPCASGTSWFHELLQRSTFAVFIKGSVSFDRPGGSRDGDNAEGRGRDPLSRAIFYSGERDHDFMEVFGPLGTVVRTVL